MLCVVEPEPTKLHSLQFHVTSANLLSPQTGQSVTAVLTYMSTTSFRCRPALRWQLVLLTWSLSRSPSASSELPAGCLCKPHGWGIPLEWQVAPACCSAPSREREPHRHLKQVRSFWLRRNGSVGLSETRLTETAKQILWDFLSSSRLNPRPLAEEGSNYQSGEFKLQSFLK